MITPTVPAPQSCDTFVYVQAPSLKGTGTLFGKNSDRPSGEHHEVIRIPSQLRHEENEVVQCTYISVPQATETLEIMLSRPSWLWGCEMGANSAGVVGGNEAIYSLLSDELVSPNGTPRKSLLGMDLLRLSLERGTSAKHAMETCIHFLEAYGQGGPCSKDDASWSYENSFLFADANEAYVLETAGKNHWAWERIGPGEHRNISNGISIRSNWGAVSKGIQSVCQENGWWDGTSKFDWKRAVDNGGSVEGLESCGGREAAGLAHLKAMKSKSNTMQNLQHPRWWVEQMADILRDEGSGICFRDRYGFCSTGSQISWLPAMAEQKDGCGKGASHLFTGASDPLCGTPYKLFLFSDPVPCNGKKETIFDNGTGRLWDLWRERALNRSAMSSSLRDALSKMEEEGLSFLDINAKRPQTFAEMVEKEVKLLLEN